MVLGDGLSGALLVWAFTLGPLTALVVALVASLRIIYELEEKWLLLITVVLMTMSQHQIIEFADILGSETYPLQISGESFETTANLLMAGSSYYVLRFAQDQRELAEEFEQTRNRHSQLIENAPTAILALIDGEIAYANPAAEALFRSTRVEGLTGRTLREFLHPEDEGKLAAELETLETGGDSVTIPPTRFVVDEEIRRATVTATPVVYEGTDATQLIIQDVTDVQEYEEQLTKTFENSNDAILIVDPEADEILECNPKACEILGYDRRTLLEIPPSRIHPEEFDAFKTFVEDIRSEGGQRTDELSCTRRDGTEIPAEISGASIRFRGRECLLAVVRDISDRKQRERRLNVLNRVLRHNLRNDMNIIRGGASTLVDAVQDEELRDIAARIRSRADDLLSLGEDVRSVESTVRQTDGGPPDVSIDASAVVSDTVADVRMEYPEARIETELPDRLPVRAEQSLSIALEQVIENGIVHNDSATPTVEVVANPDWGDEVWAELRVRDDGPGLPDHERSIVFEDEEITALQHGSGLGLWVAVWTVEAYGGEVEVTKADETGTTIAFRLKRATETTPAVAEPP